MRAWLAKADNDLLSAEAILNATMPDYGPVSFHAQQAAEKAIKALLVRHQVEFRRDHDIGNLLSLAEPVEAGVTSTVGAAAALTPSAVEGRYPSSAPPIGREEAREHLGTARQVVEESKTRLAPYLNAGRPGG